MNTDGLNQVYNHPPSGFHFSVIFEDYPSPTDMMFQEVSGLSCSTSDTIPVEEGGAAYVHERPSLKYKYDDLELKRGLSAFSVVSNLWIRSKYMMLKKQCLRKVDDFFEVAGRAIDSAVLDEVDKLASRQSQSTSVSSDLRISLNPSLYRVAATSQARAYNRAY